MPLITPGGRPPQQPPQQGGQVQVDLSLATDVLCDKCQNATFVEVLLMKKFSDITSPTGKAGTVPIPVIACNACNWVNDEFLPPILRRNAPPEQTPKLEITR